VCLIPHLSGDCRERNERHDQCQDTAAVHSETSSFADVQPD
jgi:hypothetical protein